MAGANGIEPILPESKSGALPLREAPIKLSRIQCRFTGNNPSTALYLYDFWQPTNYQIGMTGNASSGFFLRESIRFSIVEEPLQLARDKLARMVPIFGFEPKLNRV